MDSTYQKPILVIGAGLGRTGTLSLKFALERLFGGQPCYHMRELIFKHPDDAWRWVQIDRAISPDGTFNLVNGRRLFGEIFRSEYQAAVDWPAASYYRELLHVYPNAKVSRVRLSRPLMSNFT